MRRGINIYIKSGRRVVKGLGYYDVRIINDLRELVKSSVRRYGNSIGFRFKNKEKEIIGKTYVDFDKDIDCLGTALINKGLKDKRIAIIAENRYEWGVCYLSITNGTGVAVPLDKYLPSIEVENLIKRGKVEAVFYSPAFNEMMKDIAKTCCNIKYFICMEDGYGDSQDERFGSLAQFLNIGKELLEAGDRTFIDCPIDRSKMSILLFTSGTTSISKGVMLSHSNITSNIISISSIIRLNENDVHLSLLPLHHTFENSIGLLHMVHSGVCIAYCDGIKYIAQNIKEYGVTVLVLVPALLEVMYRKLQEGIEKSGKKRLVNIFIRVSESLRKIGIDVRRILFRSIFEQLGPKLRLAVSGAAPLDRGVIEGFEKIGLKILEGYGLTETSPVVSANNDFVNRPGTVGYPLSGIEVAIDNPDETGMGEVVIRGRNVMLGYYEDEEATKEVIDKDGWFKTGDLGSIDQEGFIKITGRAKSMIVLANGKKAFPEEYEVLLNNIEWVKDSFAWGDIAQDGDVEICAKIVVDKEKLEECDKEISEANISKIIGDSIKNINKTLPQYKIIRYFILSYDSIIKTTTLKIRRFDEYQKIKEELKNNGINMRKASGSFIG